MGQRRMFSKTVVSSGRFARMPATARLLYYDLGMQADDDGCVEALIVMRMTGASEDDLSILVNRGYIVVLNEDLVCWIVHWNENNTIKKDRYKPSIYADLIPANYDGFQSGTKVEPEWSQNGTKVEPQVKLSKVNISEVSSARNISTTYIRESACENQKNEPYQEAQPPERAEKKACKKVKLYGKYKNVMLSDDEYDKLLSEVEDRDFLIDDLSAFMESTGRTYQNHFATLLRCETRRKEREAKKGFQKKKRLGESGKPSYDIDAFSKQGFDLPDIE
jgi:hypothetical protein